MNGNRPRILIMGGGASGTLAAVQLLRIARSPLEVVLIDRTAGWGKGLAYGTAWPGHLLNVPSGRMSALPDDPGHFVRWLQSRSPHPGPADRFAPRVLYAAYLSHLLDEAERQAGSGVRLTLVSGWATALRENHDHLELGYLPTDGTGQPVGHETTMSGDAAVLASGHAPPRPLASTSFHHADSCPHPPSR